MSRTRTAQRRARLAYNRQHCATSPTSRLRRWMAGLRSTSIMGCRTDDKTQQSHPPRFPVTRSSSAMAAHSSRSVRRAVRSASPLLIDVSSVAGPLPCPTWWRRLQHEHDRLQLAVAIAAQQLWEAGALTVQPTPAAGAVLAVHTPQPTTSPVLSHGVARSSHPRLITSRLPRSKKQTQTRSACDQKSSLHLQQSEPSSSLASQSAPVPPSSEPHPSAPLAPQSAAAPPLPLFLRSHLSPQLLLFDADAEWSAAQLIDRALLQLPSALRSQLADAQLSLSYGCRRVLSSTPGACGTVLGLSSDCTVQLHVHAPHPMAGGLLGGSSKGAPAGAAAAAASPRKRHATKKYESSSGESDDSGSATDSSSDADSSSEDDEPMGKAPATVKKKKLVAAAAAAPPSSSSSDSDSSIRSLSNDSVGKKRKTKPTTKETKGAPTKKRARKAGTEPHPPASGRPGGSSDSSSHDGASVRKKGTTRPCATEATSDDSSQSISPPPFSRNSRTTSVKRSKRPTEKQQHISSSDDDNEEEEEEDAEEGSMDAANHPHDHEEWERDIRFWHESTDDSFGTAPRKRNIPFLELFQQHEQSGCAEEISSFAHLQFIVHGIPTIDKGNGCRSYDVRREREEFQSRQAFLLPSHVLCAVRRIREHTSRIDVTSNKQLQAKCDQAEQRMQQDAGALPSAPARFTGVTENEWTNHVAAVRSFVEGHFELFETCAERVLADERAEEYTRRCRGGMANPIALFDRHADTWVGMPLKMRSIGHELVAQRLKLCQDTISGLFEDFHLYTTGEYTCEPLPSNSTKKSEDGTVLRCRCDVQILHTFFQENAFRRTSSPNGFPLHCFWLHTDRLTAACSEMEKATQLFHNRRLRSQRVTAGVSAVRVGSYNLRTKTRSHAVTDVLQPIADMLHGEFDLVALQEVSSAGSIPGFVQPLVQRLATRWPAEQWTALPISGAQQSGETTTFVWRADRVALLEHDYFQPDGMRRPLLRGVFQSGCLTFGCISVHLKAGSSAANKLSRSNEMGILRAAAQEVEECNPPQTPPVPVLLAGDFNVQDFAEFKSSLVKFTPCIPHTSSTMVDPASQQCYDNVLVSNDKILQRTQQQVDATVVRMDSLGRVSDHWPVRVTLNCEHTRHTFKLNTTLSNRIGHGSVTAATAGAAPATKPKTKKK